MEEQNQNTAPAPSNSSEMAPAPAPADNSAPPSFDPWPGAFGIYKVSRAAVMRNLGPYLLLTLGSIVINSIVSSIFQHGNVHQFNILSSLINLVVGAFLLGSQSFVLLAGARDQRVELNDALRAGSQFFVPAVLLYLLFFVTSLTILLLVIPFLIIMPRVILAPYFMVDQKLGAVDAYKASWHATSGNVGKVWGLFGAILVMILPVFTIIGILATIYLIFMYSACTVLLYLYTQKHVQAPAA